MEQNELDALKADLKRMQAKVDELEASTAAEPVNRRNMLRGLGAAAVGAAAGGLAFSQPAAATDGNSLIIGNSTQTANSATLLIKDATYSETSYGLLHVTDDASSTGTFTSCITAAATGAFHSTAFAGTGSSYGAKLDAPIPLKLLDQSGTAALGTSAFTGSMVVIDGDLYFCVHHDDGGFGTAINSRWRKITGPSEAGSYHPLTPGRVYDSRPGGGGSGPLGTGSNRTISVANSINSVGTTVTTNFVPSGATAVVANVTIVNTAGAGNIAVNPGGSASTATSTVNWNAAGAVMANGITLTLNTNRQLTVVCSGGPGTQTNFLIDIYGYYL